MSLSNAYILKPTIVPIKFGFEQSACQYGALTQYLQANMLCMALLFLRDSFKEIEIQLIQPLCCCSKMIC